MPNISVIRDKDEIPKKFSKRELITNKCSDIFLNFSKKLQSVFSYSSSLKGMVNERPSQEKV